MKTSKPLSHHTSDSEELLPDDAQQTADEKFVHWAEHGGPQRAREILKRRHGGKLPRPQRWPEKKG